MLCVDLLNKTIYSDFVFSQLPYRSHKMNAFFVIKRDGSRIGFDLQRITNAIKKAASAVNIVDEMYIHDLSQRINTEIFSHYQHEIDINQIQKNC